MKDRDTNTLKLAFLLTQHSHAIRPSTQLATSARHTVERLAEIYGTDTRALCRSLADATGDRVATVDVVLWRGAVLGLIDELSQASEHVAGPGY